MNNLVNSTFNRTYNPSGKHNTLSDIKNFLSTRDAAIQSKACRNLINMVTKHDNNLKQREEIIRLILNKDIVLFICEATSNLDFILFSSLLCCLRLLWRSHLFFAGEYAAQSMTAVVKALTHYERSRTAEAVDACMHFLCDLLNGISIHKTASPLSHQSVYSADQLLACLSNISCKIQANQNTILTGALVLSALISYQPKNLIIRGDIAMALVKVVKQWFDLMLGTLNRTIVIGDSKDFSTFYVVLCQLGIRSLNLAKLLYHGEQKTNFVQTILADEQEITALKTSAEQFTSAVHRVASDIAIFTKEHHTQIPTEEYGVFLKLLLNFLNQSINVALLSDFCEVLFSSGYLKMLPQEQIMRNDVMVRKGSTLVLVEMLKVLANKYLNVDNDKSRNCANDIHMGLVELKYGIEDPEYIGSQLQKKEPYSLLVYIYFYCQSSENIHSPKVTAPLLQPLVGHILGVPASFQPPPYIVKALWLVFAMSTMSSLSLKSLTERIYLEKATDRVVNMLMPDPSVFYTHNPALLLWAFTSVRITDHVKFHVISQWLKVEDSLPSELAIEPSLWDILLNILVHSTDQTIVVHCRNSLQECLEEADDDVNYEFSITMWAMLPGVLSRALVDDSDCLIGSNIYHLLELATTLLPPALDPDICSKTALFVACILSKEKLFTEYGSKLDCVCLRLSLTLLGMANNQKDNRILLTFINRPNFLRRALSLAVGSGPVPEPGPGPGPAAAALQLLSYIVHYFTSYGYQPKSVLQLQTQHIIRALRRDDSERGAGALLQLVFIVLNSGDNSPLALAYDLDTPTVEAQFSALRALMFRIQVMLCSKVQENKTRSSAAWRTLGSIFKHAVSQNDSKLVATLTSQPWTHILIEFQISQELTPEFITFTHNWLILLRITVKRNQETSKRGMSRHSLLMKTLLLLKDLKMEGVEETGLKILEVVRELLRDSGYGKMISSSIKNAK